LLLGSAWIAEAICGQHRSRERVVGGHTMASLIAHLTISLYLGSSRVFLGSPSTFSTSERTRRGVRELWAVSHRRDDVANRNGPKRFILSTFGDDGEDSLGYLPRLGIRGGHLLSATTSRRAALNDHAPIGITSYTRLVTWN
jgi:hypothetical protein